MEKDRIITIYERLLKEYGPQGWWPLLGFSGTNPTKSGSVNGYHVGDYDFPRDEQERFEICIGAILTQNTAWPQVEKSLRNLQDAGLINAGNLIACNDEQLKTLIRPSGYHNQKSRYLKNFASFFIDQKEKIPEREELLAQLGIGQETADSILLYAYRVPVFVVDAYTKRIFSHLGLIGEKERYEPVRAMVETAFGSESEKMDRLIAYQEFHALIVEHAKRHYRRRPFGAGCFLG